ncbi:protein CgeB [Pullulanibacillus camelliae]|uniref:Protein CgeB n=2 Tax=Pullulanibacillus camelliae TaxID=1707096 RepID=A0A8J2VMU7_9BACL|nr:protein CgeB [Pullulanibacillus camelliae]
MNILLISSGFGGIYDYFERSIKEAIEQQGYSCCLFTIYKGTEALKGTIEENKPDIMLTLTGFVLQEEMQQVLREHAIPQVVWFTEDPFYMDQTLPLSQRYDHIFTIEQNALSRYTEAGHPHVTYLPLATNPSIFFEREIDRQKRFDINMVGFPYPERLALIAYFLEHCPYSIVVVGKKWAELLTDWSEDPRLTIIDHWITPTEAAALYNESKISLNPHRPYDLKENKNRMRVINKSLNNRTWDIAACGAFQLTSNMEEVSRFFEKDKEIVTYNSMKECVQFVEKYCHEEDERRTIAAHAKQKVLQAHTFSHRMSDMLESIASLKSHIN